MASLVAEEGGGSAQENSGDGASVSTPTGGGVGDGCHR